MESLVGGSGMAVMAFVEAEEALDWVTTIGAVSVVIVIAVATRTEVGFVIAMAPALVGTWKLCWLVFTFEAQS